ncbi:hypothetical protein ROCKSTAR_74 [Mycobacterium phage Rockstar]|uniref:Uncharacterized protein n=1 Tax=Mycobacterium phage Rockstar TaxID=1034144 RepID=G1BRH3_9CAUD|nr:hypothetical protein FDI65_gp12 [Mycobacterium phage Rockstar]AEK07437.1 hypothetical protein ROCKSTAR_74 [Mycobacterium phage Rockstar]
MDIRDIAALIPADKAQLAVARVIAALGAQESWDADTLDGVAEAVKGVVPAEVPSPFDQDDEAIEFWQEV